jgi:hypothetical protein
MKYTLSCLFVVTFSLHSFAQDRMVLPDGTSKNVSILNSDGDSLRYESDGVEYSFPKKEVMIVVYQDGRTEMFNQYQRKLTRSDNTWSPHTIALGPIYFIPVRSNVYSKPDGFDFKAGFGASIMYQYNFQKIRHLSIRATLDYVTATGKGDTVGTGLARMQVVPLTVGLKVYPGKRKNVYFVADLGAAFTSYKARFATETNTRTDTKNEVGFTAGFGLGYDIRITDQWHIEIDHTVRWLKASDRNDSTSNFFLRVLYNL